MSETMTNQPETGATTPAAEGKTFTQEDVNKIVQERLAREKTKADATFADREKELAARELQLSAREKLSEKGLPAELMEALSVKTSATRQAPKKGRLPPWSREGFF